METESQVQDHKQSISKNFNTLILREFLGKIIGFLGQLLLARILLPAEFGTFAILLFVVNFFMLFSNVGLSQIIINHDDVFKKDKIGSINTIVIGINILLVLIIITVSPFILNLYPNFSNHELLMLKIMSSLIFIDGVKSIPIAILERNLQYKTIAITETIGMVIYQVLSITLALLHFGVWSFVFALISKDIMEAIIFIYYSRWKLIILFNKNIIKDIKNFGAYIQASGILNYFAYATNPVIAGTQLGSRSVGLIDFANNIISVPESITNNFGRVAFSQFSRIKNDSNALAKISERSLSLLTSITYIFPVLLILYSKEMIAFLYTAKWQGGLPVLYALTISIFFYPIIITMGQTLLATQKAKEVFIVNIIANILNWTICLITVHFLGIIGIAFGFDILSCALAIGYIIIARISGLSINVFSNIIKRFFVAILVCVVSFFLNSTIRSQSLFIIMGEILFTVILYCAIYFFVLKKDFFAIWENIQFLKKQ